MKEIKYTVRDELGIHARPAGLLVKAAAAFKSDVKIKCGAKEADAKRLLAVMGLGVKKGNDITVTVSGADEAEAAANLKAFLSANL